MKNKGKILKVKIGYNPNSSSIGSQIPTYLAFCAGTGALTVIILNTISAINKIIKKNKSSIKK